MTFTPKACFPLATTSSILIGNMNPTEILKKLTAILVEIVNCRRECVQESATLAELGADSLDIVELVMAVEEEFGIDIPAEEAVKLLTV